MTTQAATTQVGTAMRLKRVIDPAGVCWRVCDPAS